jgi:acetyl esterase/lipase
LLDLFVPTTGKGAFPLIIKIHGGAFKAGDKAMEATTVPAILAKGYAVASLNYRLSCEAPFPAAVQDVKAAVRFLRANATKYRLDPNRFASWGESAGANLAAMLGVTGGVSSDLDDPALGNAQVSSGVQAVVGWYGPYDFLSMDAQFQASPPAACNGTTQSHDPADSPESIYVGGAIQTKADVSRKASPISYVATAKKLPPFMLAAGDSDCLVPNQQSSSFHDALKKAGFTSSFTLLKGASHGDSAFETTQTAPALAFLKKVFGK